MGLNSIVNPQVYSKTFVFGSVWLLLTPCVKGGSQTLQNTQALGRRADEP